MSTLSLSFPDSTYTEANPPSASTLKSDLSAVELGHNAHEADETNPHSVTAAQTGAAAFDEIYPVGSIYINAAVATNPGTLLGQGTWVAFGAGKVPVGVDSGDTDFDVVNSSTGSAGTGGTKTHTLTEAEMPTHTHVQNAHSHTIGTSNVGGTDNYPQKAGSTVSSTYASQSVTAVNQNAGSSSAHNNVQPYITCYMWRRTA